MRLRGHMRVGVRGKLLGLLIGTASFALLLACVVFVYYDRTSSAAVKRRSADVLAHALSQGAYGPTAFGDPDSARVILDGLTTEPTSRAGAIYGADGALLAAWHRDLHHALPPHVTAVPLLSAGDRLIARHAITGADGRVGELVVVLSTHDLAARTRRFVTLAAGVLALAVVVAIGLVLAGQRFVTRPVRELAAAAERVRASGDFEVRARRISDDELGDLTDAFNEMLSMIQARDRELAGHRAHLEDMVAQRTADLDRRNGEMRVVLDHVAQGLLTIDLAGRIGRERSAIVDQWFPTIGPDTTLPELLAPAAKDAGTWLGLGLEELAADIMPPEVVLAQMPTRFELGGSCYELAYSLVGAAPAGRLLVVITDVTALLAHQRTERAQRERLELFQRIAADRGGVEGFFREGDALIAQLEGAPDRAEERRLVHTLKGNAACYGLESFATLAHELESALDDRSDGLTPDERAGLSAAWRRVVADFAGMLGGDSRAIELDRDEYEAFVADPALPPSLRAVCQAWRDEPLSRPLARLGQQAEAVARRLGYPPPQVTIESAGLRGPTDAWRPLWSALVHVVRNAVDHGLEPPEARLAAGKPAAGHLTLRARRHGGRIELELADDGRGVDWSAVAAKAAAQGLPTDGPRALRDALFADGLSTRAAVTELSGRGVGLAAVERAVAAVGGTIDVTSTPGHGTSFRISLEAGRPRPDIAPARSHEAPRIIAVG
jgi:two-component system chemotaxis sensor kinase CheA